MLFLVLFLFIYIQSFAQAPSSFGNVSSEEYLTFSRINKEFNINSLMNSSITNDAKATEIFIASGDNVNQRNIAGVTPLHLASRNNAYEVAQILVKNNAEIDAKDNEGWTPLMRASLSGNEKIVKLLIENGANPWNRNDYGETALLHSAYSDCIECAKIIINNTNKDNFIYRHQCYEAKKIVNKKYNEEFMKLLDCKYVPDGNYEDISNKVFITKDNQTNNEAIQDNEQIINKIAYRFLGKTVYTNNENEKDITLEKETKNNNKIIYIKSKSQEQPQEQEQLKEVDNNKKEEKEKIYILKDKQEENVNKNDVVNMKKYVIKTNTNDSKQEESNGKIVFKKKQDNQDQQEQRNKKYIINSSRPPKVYLIKKPDALKEENPKSYVLKKSK